MASARRLSGVMGIGALCGLLVGGVGGRLAMLLLRVTSSDNVIGLESDDGFTIGRISASTIFLLVITAVLGAFGAILYFGVRRWLPARGRPVQMAILLGLLTGSVVVEPDGVDFVLLTPHWLAVLLFVALPAAYGGLMSQLVERRLEQGPHASSRTEWLGLLPLVLLVLLGTGGIILTLGLLGGFALLRRFPLGSPWPVTSWLVRAALLAVAALSAGNLIADIGDIV